MENWRKFLKEDAIDFYLPGGIDNLMSNPPTEEERRQAKERQEAYQVWYSSKINKMKDYYQKLLDSDMKTWEAQAGTIEHFKTKDEEIKSILKKDPKWLEFHFMRDVARGSVLSPPRSTSSYGDVSKSKLQKYQGQEYLTPIEKIGEFAKIIATEAAVAAGVGAIVTTASKILGLASKTLAKTRIGKQVANKIRNTGRAPGTPEKDAAIQKIKSSPGVPRTDFRYDKTDGPTTRPRRGGKPVKKDRLDIALEDKKFMENLSKTLDPSYDYYIHKVRYSSGGQAGIIEVNFAIKEKGFLLKPKRPTFGKISTAEEGLSSMEIAKRILSERTYTRPGPKGASAEAAADNMVGHVTNVYRVPRGMRPEDFALKMKEPVIKKVPSRGATHKRGSASRDVLEFSHSVPFQPAGAEDAGVVAVIDATGENVHLIPRMVKRDLYPGPRIKVKAK